MDMQANGQTEPVESGQSNSQQNAPFLTIVQYVCIITFYQICDKLNKCK